MDAKQLHENSRTDDTDHPGFRNGTFVQEIITVPILSKVELTAADGHCFLPACNDYFSFLIDAFNDKIDLRTQVLTQDVLVNSIGFLVTEVSRRIDAFKARNHDLELTVLKNRTGNAGTGGFHTCNLAGHDLLTAKGLQQVKQITHLLVSLGFDTPLPVDGNDALFVTDIGELLGCCGIRTFVLPCSRISLENDLIIRRLILIHGICRDQGLSYFRRYTALDDFFHIGHLLFLL